MTTKLKDLYLAQCEQWIISQRSAAQYLLGTNDIYGWMICAGSKLTAGTDWRYVPEYPPVEVFDANPLKHINRILRGIKTGQAAKDAHLDELRRGDKIYPRKLTVLPGGRISD